MTHPAYDQDNRVLHADCIPDMHGQWWFDNGQPCARPDFHKADSTDDAELRAIVTRSPYELVPVTEYDPERDGTPEEVVGRYFDAFPTVAGLIQAADPKGPFTEVQPGINAEQYQTMRDADPLVQDLFRKAAGLGPFTDSTEGM